MRWQAIDYQGKNHLLIPQPQITILKWGNVVDGANQYSVILCQIGKAKDEAVLEKLIDVRTAIYVFAFFLYSWYFKCFFHIIPCQYLNCVFKRQQKNVSPPYKCSRAPTMSSNTEMHRSNNHQKRTKNGVKNDNLTGPQGFRFLS